MNTNMDTNRQTNSAFSRLWTDYKWQLLFYLSLGISVFLSGYLLDNKGLPLFSFLKALWFGTFITYVTLHRLSFKLFMPLYLLLQIAVLLFIPAKVMYPGFVYFYLALKNVVNSNPAEGSEVISLIPFRAYVFMFLFVVVSLMTIYTGYKAVKRDRTGALHKVITVILCIVSLFISFRKPVIIGFMKNHPSTLQFYKHSEMRSITYSNNLTVLLCSYFYFIYEENEALKEQMDMSPAWDVIEVNSKYDDYVLILGESASADYISLYGYPVKNSPFMESYAKGKIVKNYYSPAANTINSLSRLLVRQDSLSQKPIIADNLMSLTKAAGFKTYWITAQRKTEAGVNSSVGMIAEKADSCVFVSKDPFWGPNSKDSAVLPVFKQAFERSAKQKRFFVVHLQGSHYIFADRLEEPLHINHYNKDISEYLQTIEQTDKLIGEIYNICKANSNSFSITYLSDHGLSPTSNESLSHGTELSSFHIPFYQISSDDTTLEIIEGRKHGLNFIEGFANWLGIKEKHLDPNYSFLLPSKKDSTALFYDFYDEYVPFSSIEEGVILGK